MGLYSVSLRLRLLQQGEHLVFTYKEMTRVNIYKEMLLTGA